MDKKSYHFIAIGGVGMSGLAKYLLQQGYKVSGSDINESKYTKQLKDLGATIYIGHAKNNIQGNPTVIVSSAIRETNPELIYAKENNLTIMHRSDLLAEISISDKEFIGFAGTHGKTTTSGLSSYLLSKANLCPSYVVGGFLPEYNTNSNFDSNGTHFIAELDESDGTIIKYFPNTMVINNLEADHLDYYKNGLSSLIETFNKLINKQNQNTKIIVNIDNQGVNLLDNKENFITFGLHNADYLATNIQYNYGFTTFDVLYKNEALASIKLIIPGEHNVYNALAVISALHQNNIDIKMIAKHFETFTGMGRRFQKVAELGEISIYDDYAHHPTEIKSTLSALKSFTDKKVVAVFQPHRYTRLQSLWDDFKASLTSADEIYITDVFAASEDEIEGVNSKVFTSEIPNATHIQGNIKDVAKILLNKLDDNCVVIGLGAGTITNLGKELKQAYEEYHGN